MWGSSAGRSGYDVEPQRTAPYAPESDLGDDRRVPPSSRRSFSLPR